MLGSLENANGFTLLKQSLMHMPRHLRKGRRTAKLLGSLGRGDQTLVSHMESESSLLVQNLLTPLTMILILMTVKKAVARAVSDKGEFMNKSLYLPLLTKCYLRPCMVTQAVYPTPPIFPPHLLKLIFIFIFLCHGSIGFRASILIWTPLVC